VEIVKRATEENAKENFEEAHKLYQNDQSGGSDTGSKDGEKGKQDADTKKQRGALASAILSEKPNVHWEDIAGLELAKKTLKEA
ncbi:Vacuolar protein sorting-associated protein 4, partial [Cladochytrium tenue]